MAYAKKVLNGIVILPINPNKNSVEHASFHTCTPQRMVSDSNSNATLQLTFHSLTSANINDIMINDSGAVITDDFGNILEA